MLTSQQEAITLRTKLEISWKLQSNEEELSPYTGSFLFSVRSRPEYVIFLYLENFPGGKFGKQF